jgi:hypothetical protein
MVRFIKVSGLIKREMVMAFKFGQMDQNMKDFGNLTKHVVMEN